MKTLLRILLTVLAAASLWPAGAQNPAGTVSDLDYAVDVVERAYAGYPDKIAGREAEYAALKERLVREVGNGRGSRDAIAEYLGWFDDNHLGSAGVRAYRPKTILRPSDYASQMKCYDPKFTHCRVDGDTYLIRFPSCDLDSAQIAGVQAAADAYLASGCENLIVDIRGNDGGHDTAYAPLFRLLYDHEGTLYGMEYRASELSVDYTREFSGNTERGRALIEQLEQAPAGSFLARGGNTYVKRLDSVSPRPRRAALIVDGRVASSGEQLVLEVRACSNRTTIYGQDNTMGCLDYSNCALVYFPQDTVPGMQVPVTRSYRIVAGCGIDRTGIVPDVRIPLPLPETLTDNVDEWAVWVAGDLKKQLKNEK